MMSFKGVAGRVVLFIAFPSVRVYILIKGA